MTIDSLKARMRTDIGFAAAYILRNNPEAVMRNLNDAGYPVDSIEDAEAALNDLLQDHELDTFRHVLSVPMLTDQISDAEVIALEQVALGFRGQAPMKSMVPQGPDDDYSPPVEAG